MEGPVGTGVTDGDEGIRSPGQGAVSSGERRRLGAPSRTMSGLRPSRPRHAITRSLDAAGDERDGEDWSSHACCGPRLGRRR